MSVSYNGGFGLWDKRLICLVLGAYMNKKLDLDGIRATKTVCIVTFLSMVVGALYLTTTCSGQEVVGLAQSFGNGLVPFNRHTTPS